MATSSDYRIGAIGGALVLGALVSGSRLSKVAKIGAGTVGALSVLYAARETFTAAPAPRPSGGGSPAPADGETAPAATASVTMSVFALEGPTALGEVDRAPQDFTGNIGQGTLKGSDLPFFVFRINGDTYVAQQAKRDKPKWTMEKWRPTGAQATAGAMFQAVAGPAKPPFVGKLINSEGEGTAHFKALVELKNGILDGYQLGEK